MKIKLRSTDRWNFWAGRLKRICCVFLVGCFVCTSVNTAWATGVSKTEKEKKEAQKNLEDAKKKAEEAEKNKSAAQAKVNQLNQDLTMLLGEIQVLEGDIAAKEGQIDQAQTDYEAAEVTEKVQYEAMKKRIKYMYEKGDTEYLDILLKAKTMADLLNKAEYVQELYSYDRKMLTVYQQAKQDVADLQQQLEEDRSEMEVMEQEYKFQQDNLETVIAQKKKDVSNFDGELAKAKKDAAIYAKTVEEKTAAIKKAQEEARKKAEAEAKKKAEEAAKANKNAAPKKGSPQKNTYSGPAAVKSSGGSAQGRAVADYGLQFVGNPYVFGGTSLTNGADCSGFTQSVYKNFGVRLPRSSSEQSRAGTAVEFEDLQPGDLVFYAGHVALYIGNGQIVHASSAKTGIKVSNVAYRSILGIRRFL